MSDKKFGFETEDAAYRAAKRRGLVGLTGSGQECCPVQLGDGSWAYWTAHNFFKPCREPGFLVVPRKVIELRDTEDLAAGVLEDFCFEQRIIEAGQYYGVSDA